MNEEHVKKIIKLEDEALAAYQEALKDTQAYPLQAEAKIKALLEQIRKTAIAEGEQIMKQAHAEVEMANDLHQAQKEAEHKEELAALHFEQAVDFVLKQLLGE